MSDRTQAARAKKLGIKEKELTALLAVREKLASGVFKHVVSYDAEDRERIWKPIFNMGIEMGQYDCGQVGCIGGWMAWEMGEDDPALYVEEHDRDNVDDRLGMLFYPPERRNYNTLTPRQAVNAIDKFLSGSKYPWGV